MRPVVRIAFLAVVVLLFATLAGCELLGLAPVSSLVIVVAYSPQNPYEYDQVLLDAGQSYDPDGGQLSFSWVLFDVPSGATGASLTVQDPASQVLLSPDGFGDYTVRLTVTSGSRSVEADVAIYVDYGGE